MKVFKVTIPDSYAARFIPIIIAIVAADTAKEALAVAEKSKKKDISYNCRYSKPKIKEVPGLSHSGTKPKIIFHYNYSEDE